MSLLEARKLRDEIQRAGYHSIVPLGHGPEGYFARIFGKASIDFYSRHAFRKHHAMRLRERKKMFRDYEQIQRIRPARSPIEIMIDQACGLR